MSDIEVTVRVPGDLEVLSDDFPSPRLTDGRHGFVIESGKDTWHDRVFQQIAAAIEARKPRPPKFQVGDVVEWSDGDTDLAGVITSERSVVDGRYYVNLRHTISEDRLTLVRRAAK